MSSSIGMGDFYHLAEEKNLPIIDVREAYEYQMACSSRKESSIKQLRC